MAATNSRYILGELLSWLSDARYMGAGADILVPERTVLGWANYGRLGLNARSAREDYWRKLLVPYDPRAGSSVRVWIRRSLTGKWDANQRKSNGMESDTIYLLGDHPSIDESASVSPALNSIDDQDSNDSEADPPETNNSPRGQSSMTQPGFKPFQMNDLNSPDMMHFMFMFMQTMNSMQSKQGPVNLGQNAPMNETLIAQLINLLHTQHQQTVAVLQNQLIQLSGQNSQLQLAWISAALKGNDGSGLTLEKFVEVAGTHGPNLKMAFQAVASDPNTPEPLRKMGAYLGGASLFLEHVTNGAQRGDGHSDEDEPDNGYSAPGQAPSNGIHHE